MVILLTKIFVFLSLNDFLPLKSKSSIPQKKLSLKNYIYKIWEILFALLYLAIGIILLYYEFILREFNSNRDLILIFLVIVFFVTLGIVKLIKVNIKGERRLISLILIIYCIIFSFSISFLNLYNYHTDYTFIHSLLGLIIFTFMFLPINIELAYEVFLFFLRQKEKPLNQFESNLKES